MTTTSFVARVRNAWHAIVNPTASLVEYELSQDAAERHPQERIPTKRQYEKSRYGSAGLEIRAQRTNRKRANLSAQLLAAKASADVADKRLTDFAGLPYVMEVLRRVARLRADHPLHEERLAFRKVQLKRWFGRVAEPIIVIADWGVWFSLLMVGFGLSFSKMAGPTDPTKVYNPDWFIAHPAEWVTAFVVPTIVAIAVLIVAKLAARRWAQHGAIKNHPERAVQIQSDVNTWERVLWLVLLAGFSAVLYLVAKTTFAQFADELGGWIAIPWALFPWIVFLIDRYGQDPVAAVDALILRSAEDVEARKQQLGADLMAAEDRWRASWTSYDDLIREIIDGASGDIGLFEQILMRADANSGRGSHLAPIGEQASVITGRSVTPVASTGTPARPIPVVLEPQRGLVTEVSPWITKQIELDLQVLTDCRPPVDSGRERTARIAERFEAAYEAAVAKHDARRLADSSADIVLAPSAPRDEPTDVHSVPIDFGPGPWDRERVEGVVRP